MKKDNASGRGGGPMIYTQIGRGGRPLYQAPALGHFAFRRRLRESARPPASEAMKDRLVVPEIRVRRRQEASCVMQ